jgi:hypothetical protein
MKKKAVIFTLLLCMLAASANADTFYTLPKLIEQAKAGWHETYQAHGRTIAVDITPLLPEAEQFPVLYCSWKQDWDLVPKDGEKHDLEVNGQPHMAENRGYQFLVKKPANGREDVAWTVNVNGKAVKVQPYRVYYPPFDQDKAYIPANKTTLGEITEMTKEIMKGLGIDENFLWKEPKEFGTHSFYEKNDKENPLAPGIGFITWDQALKGIPIIGDLRSNIAKTFIDITFQNKDSCGWNFILWNIDSEIAEDVPLCGFDKVIKALEKEIEDGRLRAVFEIKLGYGQFNEDGASDDYRRLPGWERRYYLKPIWRVHGIWVKNAKSSTEDLILGDEPGYRNVRNSAHQTFISIDAQTGKIISNTNAVDYVPIDKTYYRGYLSWEDAGGKPKE